MYYSLARRSRRRHAKKHAVKHDRRGRKYGRHHNPDWKIVGMAGLAGIAALLVGNELNKRVEFFQKNWYALPAAAILGGAYALQRMPTVGVAAIAVGGALGYIGYMTRPADGSAKAAAGFGDAGYWRQGYGLGPQMRRDSGLFERPHAGALLGAAATDSVRSQAGALLGAAAPTVKMSQASGMGNAGSIYASAMGLES